MLLEFSLNGKSSFWKRKIGTTHQLVEIILPWLKKSVLMDGTLISWTKEKLILMKLIQGINCGCVCINFLNDFVGIEQQKNHFYRKNKYNQTNLTCFEDNYVTKH